MTSDSVRLLWAIEKDFTEMSFLVSPNSDGPMITCPQTLEVRENEALNGCTVEGNPPPELTWYQGDVKVDRISKLGKMDGGQYTLFAESKPFSSVHHSVEVVIISKGECVCV